MGGKKTHKNPPSKPPPSTLPSGARVGPPGRRRDSAPTTAISPARPGPISEAAPVTPQVSQKTSLEVEGSDAEEEGGETTEATPRAPAARDHSPSSLPTVQTLEEFPSSQDAVPETSEADQSVVGDTSTQSQPPSDPVVSDAGISSRLRRKRKKALPQKKKRSIPARKGKKRAKFVEESESETSMAEDEGESEVEDEDEDEYIRPVKKTKTSARSALHKGTKKDKGKKKAVEESRFPRERLFLSEVSIPLLPPPVASSFRLPPPRPRPIPPTSSLRKTASGEVHVIKASRSQGELRHNIGSIGPLIVREEIRDIFMLPDTHSLQNDVRCSNCIIRAKDECKPPPSFIGSCGECSVSKTAHCSFSMHPEVELTELGHLNAYSSVSTYNLMRSTQSLLADQSGIHLTLALLQNQLTRAALNIEAYAHEWQMAGAIHGARRLSDYGLARSPEEVQDFLDFLTAHNLGTKDSVLSRRIVDQQNVISQAYSLIGPRASDQPVSHAEATQQAAEEAEVASEALVVENVVPELVLDDRGEDSRSMAVQEPSTPADLPVIRFSHSRSGSWESNRPTASRK
ncbi:hypothetical protein Agabi119p4_7085 [Agaricus bisporus var. burnettii]|uniref:Uncharacterized protein n=1 Tax=Agaricus bisporus var. burnettii TaxID=192524 RepID=A0A8H7F0P0_AGABI|nr:hypothetical protein Agabi119p4_8971 [Agaricus bisporus var. burnettii]KAF7771111.1 hypothetical protein Agabi119p4_7085 [Agaricus bisporus var. burnettii]